MITESDARKAVRRLLDVFSTSKTEDKLTKAIVVVFDGEPVSPPDLMAATTWYLKSDVSYMPTAGKLLTKAKELGNSVVSAPVENRGRDDALEPCEVCGARPRWLKPHELVNYGWEDGESRNLAPPVEHGERYGTLHDLRRHREAGVPPTGYWR